MTMKTIKVAEATERQLDWLVAKCEGLKLHHNALLGGQIKEGWWVSGYYIDPNNWIPLSLLNYSTNWSQGGQIIEREGISIYRMTSDWSAAYNPSGAAQDGPTPLIAAMRCFCCSKLGDVVDIPEELCQQQSN